MTERFSAPAGLVGVLAAITVQTDPSRLKGLETEARERDQTEDPCSRCGLRPKATSPTSSPKASLASAGAQKQCHSASGDAGLLR
jgi:hypothetical protein